MVGKSAQIEVHSLSHKGLVRSNNEDSIGSCELKSKGKGQVLLAVLADGVGGHNAGEIASRIAVDTIIMNFNNVDNLTKPLELLETAILNANQAILDNVNKNPNRLGMGTTCVCILIIQHTLYAAHLGDSRLYLLRGRTLSRLTDDHTLFEEYKHLSVNQSNSITRSHPMAHVLSRYLGSTQTISMDKQLAGIGKGVDSLVLKSDDTLLLCSDGITDMLPDSEIEHILHTCTGRKCAQTLIYRALENGGHDNASLIVIKIP